jgi:hypothetical protein
MAPVELAAVDSTAAGHWKADGSGRFDLTHDLVRKVSNFSGSCFDLTHDLVRKVYNFSGSCFISPTTAEEDRAARSLRRCPGGGALRA